MFSPRLVRVLSAFCPCLVRVLSVFSPRFVRVLSAFCPCLVRVLSVFSPRLRQVANTEETMGIAVSSHRNAAREAPPLSFTNLPFEASLRVPTWNPTQHIQDIPPRSNTECPPQLCFSLCTEHTFQQWNHSGAPSRHTFPCPPNADTAVRQLLRCA